MSKTKIELGNALKKLAYEKQFDKISVSDITSKCNLNRQTFYYHFQDKYECLEWIYKHDCLLPLKNEMNKDNWESCIEKMLFIMSNDKEFYRASISDNPKIFINSSFNALSTLFQNLINQNDENKSLRLNSEFITEFLATGIVGMVVNWVSKGMKASTLIFSEQFRTMAENMRKLKEI